VTKLPVDPEVAEAVETDPEDTAETAEHEEEPEKPPRRGLFRRRRAEAETGPADPWEA
jgi:hypothetical protein